MWTSLQTFVLLFAIAEALSQNENHRDFRVYFTSVSTKSFSDELKLNSSVDTTVGSISFHAKALTTIRKPYVLALAYTDAGNGRYDLEVFNRTIDVCMLLQNSHYEPLLQIAIKMLKKDTRIFAPIRCPILKKLFSYKDVVINPAILPPAMPEKRALIKLTFLSKDDSIFKDLGVGSGYVRIERIRRTKGPNTVKFLQKFDNL